jgi:hypothetical protein
VRSKAVIRKDIRIAKLALQALAMGSPAREAAVQTFWKLQSELGRVELAELQKAGGL